MTIYDQFKMIPADSLLEILDEMSNTASVRGEDPDWDDGYAACAYDFSRLIQEAITNA